MPRVTLTFDLPEEREEFMDAMDGWRWHGLVQDFDEHIRLQIKHRDKEKLQEARDELWRHINEAGLSLWD
jgi:hypothetical protein